MAGNWEIRDNSKTVGQFQVDLVSRCLFFKVLIPLSWVSSNGWARVMIHIFFSRMHCYHSVHVLSDHVITMSQSKAICDSFVALITLSRTSKTKKSYSVTKHPLNPVTRTRQLAKHFAMFRSYVPQCNCTLFKGTVDQIKFFLKSASTHFGFNLKARLNLSVLSYCTWNL